MSTPITHFDQVIGHNLITDADADGLTDGYSDADGLHTHNAKLDKALASGKIFLGNAQGQAEAKLHGVVRTTQEFQKLDNATLSNIPGLSVPVQAGKSYLFRAYLFLTCGAGGAKIAAGGTCTASATRYDAIVGSLTEAPNYLGAAATRATALGGAGAWASGNVRFGQIVGYLTVANSGNLTIQFAQASDEDETSTVLVGSWLRVEEL